MALVPTYKPYNTLRQTPTQLPLSGAGAGGMAGGAPVVTNRMPPVGALPGPAGTSIPNTFVDAAGRAYEYGGGEQRPPWAGGGTNPTYTTQLTPYGALANQATGIASTSGAQQATSQSPFTLDWFNSMFQNLTQPPSATPAREPAPERPDTSQAYARTKEDVGRSTKAAQTQLMEQLVNAGHDPNSPFVQAQLANVASGGTRALGDAALEIEKANERWGSEVYQGGMTQRGQDIGMYESDLARRWGLLPSLLALLRTNPAY